jgi:hypothetical protein
MRISEDSLWNGVYKKLSTPAGLEANQQKMNTDEVAASLISEPHWNLSDGTQVQFTDSGYTVRSSTGTDTGRFSIIFVGANPIIQFRSAAKQAFFDKAYVVSTSAGTDGKKAYLMEPVSLVPSGFIKNEKLSFKLESGVENENTTVNN